MANHRVGRSPRAHVNAVRDDWSFQEAYLLALQYGSMRNAAQEVQASEYSNVIMLSDEEFRAKAS